MEFVFLACLALWSSEDARFVHDREQFVALANPHSDRSVLFGDYHRFEHMFSYAWENYHTAQRHQLNDSIKLFIGGWHGRDAIGDWNRDCAWRSRAWGALNSLWSALDYRSFVTEWVHQDGRTSKEYPPYDEAHLWQWNYRRQTAYESALEVIDALAELRAIIGEESYEAGAMPRVLPNYKTGPQ